MTLEGGWLDVRADPASRTRSPRCEDRDYEKDLAETTAPHHYNLHLLAYGALGGGALSDKYLDGTAGPNTRHKLYPK